jgi:hypothetical protein
MKEERGVSEADRIRLLAAKLAALTAEIVDVLNIAADGIEGEGEEDDERQS